MLWSLLNRQNKITQQSQFILLSELFVLKQTIHFPDNEEKPMDEVIKKLGPRVLRYRGQVRWVGNFLKLNAAYYFVCSAGVLPLTYVFTSKDRLFPIVAAVAPLIIGAISLASY